MILTKIVIILKVFTTILHKTIVNVSNIYKIATTHLLKTILVQSSLFRRHKMVFFSSSDTDKA